MEFYEYITNEGDRWDLIAYEFYGDSTMYEQIIVANPDVSIIPILPAGIVLNIPILEEIQDTTTDLPPWKTA